MSLHFPPSAQCGTTRQPRRPSGCRRAMGRYLAVALGLILTITLGISTPAMSYVEDPSIDGPALGEEGEPNVDVTITHALQKKGTGNTADTIERGDIVSYQAKWVLTNFVSAGDSDTADEVTISVAASSKAPWHRPVQLRDFRPSSGLQVKDLTCTAEGLSCEVTVVVPAGGAGGTVTFYKWGDVTTKGDTYEVVYASANASFTQNPKIALREGRTRYFTPDPTSTGIGNYACSGTFNFEWTLDNGAWLADLKFADVEAQGKIILDDSPLVADQSAPNHIRVTDASGRDITKQVLDGMTWRSPDRSQPMIADNAVTRRNPNALWLMSGNWRINSEVFTGDTWLPAGSTVSVGVHGEHKACWAGFAADYDSTRPVGAALEVTRPQVEGSDFATTEFTLDGKEKPRASCETGLYYVEDWGKTQADFGHVSNVFYGDNNADLSENAIDRTRLFGINQPDGSYPSINEGRYRSIAVHESHPERLYFMVTRDIRANTAQRGLLYYDTNDRTYHMVNTNLVGDMQNIAQRTSYGLSFDQHGDLWVVFSSRKFTANHNYFYRLPLSQGDPSPSTPMNWIYEADIESPAAVGEFWDLAFDRDDNAYVIATSGPTGKILKFARSEMSGGIHKTWLNLLLTGDHVISTITDGSGFYGIAWGPDGYLYTSALAGAYYRIPLRAKDRTIPAERIGLPSRQPISPESKKYVSTSRAVDLASCLYGDIVEPPTPDTGVRVQKSVVDPVTNQVVDPGTASPNNATLDALGRATIDYVFTVANTTETATDPGTITDTLTIPTGFTLDAVEVDGTAITPVSSIFTVKPGSLSAGASRSYHVRIRVHAEDRNAVNWKQAGTCEDMSYDGYTGGFFNQVSMPDDLDGTENNIACIPVDSPPTSQLTLTKVISVDGIDDVNASEYGAHSRYFELSAVNVAGGETVSGVSAQSGQLAVDSTVLSGTYRLGETAAANHLDDTANYDFGTTWTCKVTVDGVPDTRDVSAGNLVKVNSGERVDCQIVNTPGPKFTVKKVAASPDSHVSANGHIGQSVTFDAEGNVDLTYRIRVDNLTDHRINTGEIIERFDLPAGLDWRLDVTRDTGAMTRRAPTIFQGSSAGTTITSGMSAAQMVEDSTILAANSGIYAGSGTVVPRISTPAGVAIASNIEMAARGYAEFSITMHLRRDDRVRGTSTVYREHAETLNSCEVQTATDGYRHTTRTRGVPNVVYSAHEDEESSPHWKDDNIACIPVEEPPTPVPPMPNLPLTGGTAALMYWVLGTTILASGAIATIIRHRRRRVRVTV